MRKFQQSLFIVGLLVLCLGFRANAQNNLSGTYRLDTSRGDNVREIVDEALNSGNVQNRDDARQDLEQKLESPESLAIEVRGNQVALASTLAQRLDLTADGQDRTQNLPDGTTLRVRTTLRGQQLTVSSLNSDNDYNVTFSAIDNGRALKVTRRLTTDYLRQTVFAESFYTKIDSIARFENLEDNQGYNSNSTNNGNYDPQNTGNNYPTTPGNFPTSSGNPPRTRTAQVGQYIVPNGEIITGTLENMISTKVSQNNDRFRMRVTSPNQFRGAVIEGYLSGIDRSSRNPIDNSRITLNFETIRLSNGQIYDFAGFLQGVTDANGRNVKVDSEGTITKSQSKEAAKRAGMGAGVGAIIGGIIGGAKGAIIGAGIGAGGGAGTIAIENKGDLELEAGASLTIQASSPIR